MIKRRWRIAQGQGDFLPLVIGSVMLFVSLPAFVLMLVATDRDWGVIGLPVLVILGVGVVLGAGFLVLGIQLCSQPGSLTYRLAHGRIFWR
jgi:hypothetical protein